MVAWLRVSPFTNTRNFKHLRLAIKGISIQPYHFKPKYSSSEENAGENFSGPEECGIDSLKPNRGSERVTASLGASVGAAHRGYIKLNAFVVKNSLFCQSQPKVYFRLDITVTELFSKRVVIMNSKTANISSLSSPFDWNQEPRLQTQPLSPQRFYCSHQTVCMYNTLHRGLVNHIDHPQPIQFQATTSLDVRSVKTSTCCSFKEDLITEDILMSQGKVCLFAQFKLNSFEKDSNLTKVY